MEVVKRKAKLLLLLELVNILLQWKDIVINLVRTRVATIKMDERKKGWPRVKPTTKLKSKKEKYIKTTPKRSRSFEALKGHEKKQQR